MNLCDYKQTLGVPRQGFHEARIADLALNDIIGTIIIIIILVMWLGTNIITTTIGVFALATFLHWLFCVDTALMVKLKSIF